MPTTPGIARAALASKVRTEPPIVGGRATTVGTAATGRSSAYFALPVTMSRASNRVVGVPMRVNCDGDFGVPGIAGVVTLAASTDNEPYVATRPSRATTLESRVVNVVAPTPKRCA